MRRGNGDLLPWKAAHGSKLQLSGGWGGGTGTPHCCTYLAQPPPGPEPASWEEPTWNKLCYPPAPTSQPLVLTASIWQGAGLGRGVMLANQGVAGCSAGLGWAQHSPVASWEVYRTHPPPASWPQPVQASSVPPVPCCPLNSECQFWSPPSESRVLWAKHNT